MNSTSKKENHDLYSELIERFFNGVSPYNNFNLEQYEEKVEGWHCDSPVFEELIEEIKPSAILEVGSWLGGSAIKMADICREKELTTSILCVDTWLGGAEFWEGKNDPTRYKQLNLLFGYPSVYYQFIANVIHRRHHKRILPLPQTSLIAGRALAKEGLKFPMIYIDASHEEDDVYADISTYWKILARNGVIFGDDYDQYWPGVVTAIHRFSSEMNLEIERRGGFWCIRNKLETSRNDKLGSIQVKEELTALKIENTVLRARLEAQNSRNDQIADLLVENSKLVEKTNAATARAGFLHYELKKCEEALAQLRSKLAIEGPDSDG